MKKAMKIIGVVFAGFVLLAIVFAVGVEVGHRCGYDEGWRDCKWDAKEDFLGGKSDFWKWYGSYDSHIRRQRSFWLE